MRYYLLLLLIICSAGAGYAQDQQKVWQLSGLVVGKVQQQAIPYVKIQINHTRRGILSNAQGFFSIPVVETDTVFFLRLGYKPSYMVMGEYLKKYEGDKSSQYVYSIAYMKEDTILLPTVTIHPYDTPEKLRTAMLSMKNPEFSEDAFARENMDPAELEAYIENLPVDAGERVMVGRQIYYQEHQTRNLMPVMPLFDPVAVYRLLKYINDKSKKERDKNLNYWED